MKNRCQKETEITVARIDKDNIQYLVDELSDPNQRSPTPCYVQEIVVNWSVGLDGRTFARLRLADGLMENAVSLTEEEAASLVQRVCELRDIYKNSWQKQSSSAGLSSNELDNLMTRPECNYCVMPTENGVAIHIRTSGVKKKSAAKAKKKVGAAKKNEIKVARLNRFGMSPFCPERNDVLNLVDTLSKPNLDEALLRLSDWGGQWLGIHWSVGLDGHTFARLELMGNGPEGLVEAAVSLSKKEAAGLAQRACDLRDVYDDEEFSSDPISVDLASKELSDLMVRPNLRYCVMPTARGVAIHIRTPESFDSVTATCV